MIEHDLFTEIALAHSRADSRLWRANAGRAWQGEPVQRSPNSLTLKHPRQVQLAPKGFPDMFGLKRITITHDMVGRSLGVFVGLELKSATGVTSDAQDLFLDVLRSLHAFHGVARSLEDATRILTLVPDYP